MERDEFCPTEEARSSSCGTNAWGNVEDVLQDSDWDGGANNPDKEESGFVAWASGAKGPFKEFDALGATAGGLNMFERDLGASFMVEDGMPGGGSNSEATPSGLEPPRSEEEAGFLGG